MKPHFRQPLIATRSGKAFTGTGFATLWRRAMDKTSPKGRETDRFTLNDLRSQSASDTAELAEASARLGHTTTAVTKSLRPEDRQGEAVEIAPKASRFPRFAAKSQVTYR